MIHEKTYRSDEQDQPLFCECHGDDRQQVIYVLKDPVGGEKLWACQRLFNEMVRRGEVIPAVQVDAEAKVAS